MNPQTVRSTEFVMTAATTVGVVASAVAGALPARWAAVCVAVSQVGYAISRGLAKSNQAPAPAPARKAAAK